MTCTSSVRRSSCISSGRKCSIILLACLFASSEQVRTTAEGCSPEARGGVGRSLGARYRPEQLDQGNL